jgi:Ca2+-transporting ATPase
MHTLEVVGTSAVWEIGCPNRLLDWTAYFSHCTSVDAYSSYGKTLTSPNENPEIIALQAKPCAIAKLGSAAGPLLFIVLSVKFLVGLSKQSLFVDTIIVAVVPKACEVMGNASTLYSDKTDTLTQNQMQAVSRTIRTNLQLEGS